MNLGEIGSNILDIHDQCSELGMSDEDIQSLQIVDSIQFVFGKKVVQAKNFILKLQETEHGYLLLKEEL